jgi:glutathione S-transferase
MIELYQFPFSHYCEKVRWALDYKGVGYRPVNLLPGFHFRQLAKLAPKTCVPVLRDDSIVVQDSSAIIDYLDQRYTNPALTPSDPNAAGEALDWEEYLDEQIGVNIRLWFYHHTLPVRRLGVSFLLQGAAWHKKPLFVLVYPKVRGAMLQSMNINTDTARQAEGRLRAGLEKLDEALVGRRFLVNDRFSRADLTACALLRRSCMPDDTYKEIPPAVRKLRDELKSRRLCQWVRSVYASYRQPLPARVSPSR